MSSGLLAACLVAGVGTWALRVVPLLLARRREGATAGSRGPLRPYLDGFLSAMAVASVAALLVSGAEPFLSAAWRAAAGGDVSAGWRQAAALAVGLGATAALYLWRRGVALGTVGGSIAYGLAAWLLGV